MNRDQLAALRVEYEGGILSEHVLCSKYQISASRLRSLVTKHGWNRLVPPTEEKVLDAVSLFSFDAGENAVLTAANIVAIHRKDVAQLRSIANIIVERLGLDLSGQLVPNADGVVPIYRGGKESPADLLEKLSRVLVRTTEIERQAYGLKTFNPEEAATDAQLQKELDELTEQIETIAAEKSKG